MGGPELDEKYHYSFHTDDSFDAINDGPQLAPVKPDCVPMLDLEGLPAYETSSEEGEEGEEGEEDYEKEEFEDDRGTSGEYSRGTGNNQHQTANNYKESMKYIQSYYDKY